MRSIRRALACGSIGVRLGLWHILGLAVRRSSLFCHGYSESNRVGQQQTFLLGQPGDSQFATTQAIGAGIVPSHGSPRKRRRAMVTYVEY